MVLLSQLIKIESPYLLGQTLPAAGWDRCDIFLALSPAF